MREVDQNHGIAQFNTPNTDETIIEKCLNATRREQLLLGNGESVVLYSYKSNIDGDYIQSSSIFEAMLPQSDYEALITDGTSLDTKQALLSVLSNVISQLSTKDRLRKQTEAQLTTTVANLANKLANNEINAIKKLRQKAGQTGKLASYTTDTTVTTGAVQPTSLENDKAAIQQSLEQAKNGNVEDLTQVLEQNIDYTQQSALQRLEASQNKKPTPFVQLLSDILIDALNFSLTTLPEVVTAVSDFLVKNIEGLEGDENLCCLIKFAVSIRSYLDQLNNKLFSNALIERSTGLTNAWQQFSDNFSSDLQQHGIDLNQIISGITSAQQTISKLKTNYLIPIETIINNTNRAVAHINYLKSVFVGDIKLPSLLGAVALLILLFTIRAMQFVVVGMLTEMENRIDEDNKRELDVIKANTPVLSIINSQLSFYNSSDVKYLNLIFTQNIAGYTTLLQELVNLVMTHFKDWLEILTKQLLTQLDKQVLGIVKRLIDNLHLLPADRVLQQLQRLLLMFLPIIVNKDMLSLINIGSVANALVLLRGGIPSHKTAVDILVKYNGLVGYKHLERARIDVFDSEQQYAEKLSRSYMQVNLILDELLTPIINAIGLNEYDFTNIDTYLHLSVYLSLNALIDLFSAIVIDMLLIDMTVTALHLLSSIKNREELVLAVTHASEKFKELHTVKTTSVFLDLFASNKLLSIFMRTNNLSLSPELIAQQFFAILTQLAKQLASGASSSATRNAILLHCGYLSLTPIEYAIIYNSYMIFIRELLRLIVLSLSVMLIDMLDTISIELLKVASIVLNGVKYNKVDLTSWLKPLEKLLNSLHTLFVRLNSTDPLKLKAIIKSCFEQQKCSVSNVYVLLGKRDISDVLKSLQADMKLLALALVTLEPPQQSANTNTTNNKQQNTYISVLSSALYKTVNDIMELVNPWTLVKALQKLITPTKKK